MRLNRGLHRDLNGFLADPSQSSRLSPSFPSISIAGMQIVKEHMGTRVPDSSAAACSSGYFSDGVEYFVYGFMLFL